MRACSPEVDAHEAGEHQLAEYRAEPFGLGDLVLAASVGRAGGLGEWGKGILCQADASFLDREDVWGLLQCRALSPATHTLAVTCYTYFGSK